MKLSAQFELQQPRYLLLASTEGGPESLAGYTALSRYLPDALLIRAPRREPSNWPLRLITGVVSRLAAARWARLGSLAVEWQAWRLVRKGFRGVVHFLWGDRDWAFLDYGIANEPALCATFHACPDNLEEVFGKGKRLHRLDAIILMSEVQRPFFEACGVPSQRIHVVHHGVDCDFFSPPAARNVAAPFQVLSVGNYRRNFGRLRDVCMRLGSHPGIKIAIVAPPAQQHLFSDLPNVEFASGLSNEALASSYRRASCLLMTIDGATANNAILEAMACGLPIVSENVGGIAEYTGPDAAALCSPGDIVGLEKSILELQRQPGMAIAMGKAARGRALELDWTQVAQRTRGVYDKLLTAKDLEAPSRR